jgi:antitoxin (DNA-binding transcriptional repressor) of toxin-antitoxin stability system
MKVLTIEEAREQLPELCDEVQNGETVLLRRGDSTFRLTEEVSEAALLQELGMTQDELETELLKGARGPFTSHQRGDLRRMIEKRLAAKSGG